MPIQLRRKIIFIVFATCLLTIPFIISSYKAHVRAANIGVLEVERPQDYSQVIAISDVHGMYAKLIALLQAAKFIDSQLHWSAGKSLFIILGGSIDKGPQSVEVLELWMRLALEANEVGGQVVHLLGNSEAEFLAEPNAKSANAFHQELDAKNISYNEFFDPVHPHGAYLNAMPIAAKVGNWLFCHAGAYPDLQWREFKKNAAIAINAHAYSSDLLLGSDSILQSNDWWKDLAQRNKIETRLAVNGFYGLVQGHQANAYNIKNDIGAIDGGKLIKIDSGMYAEAGSNPARLLVFTNPEEMTKMQFPSLRVFTEQGESKPLVPNEYTAE